MTALRVIVSGCVLCAASATVSLAASGFTNDFNGSGSTLADTGFSGAYNYNADGITVSGGRLNMLTEPGDSFGNYENDPDTAQNWLYNPVDVGPQTIATAHLSVTGLSQNFHGGGIWMGTDQDHYVRLGVFHNSFVTGGPIAVELLRENQDRWTGATPPGQGDDIVSNATGVGAVSIQPLDVLLRLTRTGNTVTGEYSLNGGTTYLPAGSFGGFALPGDPQGLGSNTIEDPTLKVGLYNAGGGNATFSFDSIAVTPEPATLGALTLAGVLVRRRR